MFKHMFKMIMADPAARAELEAALGEADAPAVARKATPKAKGKRKGNPEALRKWRESQKAAKAAAPVKAKAPAGTKAKAAPAKAEKADREEFPGGIAMGAGTKDKKGRTWVPVWVNGEYVGGMRADLARALFIAIRSEAAKDMLAHIALQAV